MKILKQDTSYFNKRKFHIGKKEKVDHLEKIGKTFIDGFYLGISLKDFGKLVKKIEKKEIEFLGFAYEGAAMAISIKDILLLLGKKRFIEYLHKYGQNHNYMIHVGAGWAFAKIPFNPLKWIDRLDPLLKYLAIDGYGFHHAYFKTKQYVYEKKTPKWFTGFNLRVFYQGLGRCLWFVDCADVNRIPNTIKSFPVEHHPDLWSGIGLASSYAGGVTEEELLTLKKNAQNHRSQLAQGAAFGAKARIRAGNLVPHTEKACNIFCLTTAEEAAKITDDQLINLPFNDEKPAYEIWRQRIREQFENKLISV